MRSKISKVTVATRITIPLREVLDEEALENDLSFCAYLEHLLINRATTSEKPQEALKEKLTLIEEERDDLKSEVEALELEIMSIQNGDEIVSDNQQLLDRIQELENELAFISNEQSEIEEEISSIEDDDIYTGNLSDLKDDLEQVETQYVELKEAYESSVSNNQLIIADLEQQVIDLRAEAEKFKATEEPHQNQLTIDNDALQFLQEKHPNLSKEAIIKSALDCSATNEGKWLTVYSFSDYVNRSKSFINYQNNEA